MRRLAISLSIAALVALGTVAAVSAADPTATPAPDATTAPATDPAPLVNGPATGTISGILGLSQAEIQQLRLQGKTLAQMAEDKGINPQRLIDALAARWGARIDARLAAGAITADEAAALKANVALQAKAMVNQAVAGGMRGSAVGAGPGAMGGQGTMNGRGAMNGGGQGRGGAANGGMGGGMAQHGARAGSGAGSGTCPLTATPAPQS